MARKLRSNANHYLIGFEETEILGAKLPILRRALKVFLFFHQTEHLSIRESAKTVIKQVKEIWIKARIKTREDKHCIEKIEEHFKEWQRIKKSKGRTSQRQKGIENEFVRQLDMLFDIAHANALEQCKFEEDKLFLIAQRQSQRTGCIGPADETTFRKEKRRQERIEREDERKKRCIEQSSQSSEVQCK